MKPDPTKPSEEELVTQITRVSLARALLFSLVALPVFSFLFFGIDKPDNLTLVLGDVFAIVVLSLMVFGFTFLIFYFIKAAKYGIKPEPCDFEAFEYYQYFPPAYTQINPATGLPMIGGIDIAGNPCGSKRR